MWVLTPALNHCAEATCPPGPPSPGAAYCAASLAGQEPRPGVTLHLHPDCNSQKHSPKCSAQAGPPRRAGLPRKPSWQLRPPQWPGEDEEGAAQEFVVCGCNPWRRRGGSDLGRRVRGGQEQRDPELDFGPPALTVLRGCSRGLGTCSVLPPPSPLASQSSQGKG